MPTILQRAVDAVEVGQRMRNAQRLFFSSKSQADLVRAKELERLFDETARDILDEINRTPQR